MRSKDKKEKRLKITLKNVIYFLAFIIILLYMVILYDRYFVKNDVYAKETSGNIENIKISNATMVNIDELINFTSAENLREEYSTQEVELEYITEYKENPRLPKNTIQVIQEGRSGKQEITNKRTYKNDELINEEQVSIKVTKASIDKIVEIGTANYSNYYEAKVGDNIYVTSDRLPVMTDPDENSIKIATLNKGKELKLLEINSNWYKISSDSIIGYVKKESTTTINSEEKNTNGGKTKAELISNLSFNMLLNKPSGMSLEQFKKVLTDSKDINKIFENNAEYFYYIEKQYNINGIFVASIGIHESAWGTSKIAKDKNNLFGYGAYDSNPYNGAYTFTNYSESIDLLARVLVKYYLNPSGTSIYDSQKAVGTYYNGATLTGVNTKYATDKGWASKVYNYMKYLYNKL